MIEDIRDIKSEKSDLKKFGITIGIILLVIAGLLLWKDKELFQIFLIIGAILCLLGLAMPFSLKPVYWMWMIITYFISWIMTPVILSFVFYLIITPIGLIGRLFGKQFINLRWDKLNDSYWNIRINQEKKKKHYKNQY